MKTGLITLCVLLASAVSAAGSRWALGTAPAGGAVSLCLRAALPAGGEDRDRLLAEAAADRAEGDYASAVKKLKGLVDENPADVDALLGLAELYATADDPEFYDGKVSVEYGLMAYDRAPDDLAVVEILAEGYFAQSRFERAVAELMKCIDAAPGNVRYYKKLKRYALTWKGRLEIGASGGDDVEMGKALFYLGMAAYHLGDFEKSLDSFSKARDKGASDSRLDLYQARAAVAAGRPGEARTILQGREKELSTDAGFLLCMGRACAAAGDDKGAVSWFAKARNLNPGLDGLLLDLGRAYLRVGENVKALMVFLEALEHVTGRGFRDRRLRAAIRFDTGKALERLGELDRALEMDFYAASALDGPPGAEAALAALFEHARGGKKEGMRASIARWSRHFPDGPFPRWGAPVSFRDVSGEAGVSGEGGVSWADFDRDGRPDLLVGGRNLFHNEGRKAFAGLSSRLGLAAVRNAAGGIFADYDNDGDLDLFLIRRTAGVRDRLFRFDGMKRGFVDITEAAGNPGDPQPTAGAAFGDLNGDGFVDLYLAGCGKEGQRIPGSADSLFLNLRNGTFRAAAADSGTVAAFPMDGEGVAIADTDNDGDMDVFVANGSLQPNLFWRNERTGSLDEEGAVRFADAAGPLGLKGIDRHGKFGNSRCVVPGDLDGDGDIDFFVANEAPFQDWVFAGVSQLLLNSGRPAFVFHDAAATSGLVSDESPSNAALGDVDNDGDLDLFVTEKGPQAFCRLYVNDGKARFQDATWLSGIVVRNASGCAFADYDGDGDLDLYVSGEGGKLFENSGNGNHWIGFRLEGAKCNGTGIGARVTVDLPGGRSMVREVRGGRGFCQDDMTVHFGLGPEKVKVNVSIQWPHGRSAFLKGLKPDRYYVLKDR